MTKKMVTPTSRRAHTSLNAKRLPVADTAAWVMSTDRAATARRPSRPESLPPLERFEPPVLDGAAGSPAVGAPTSGPRRGASSFNSTPTVQTVDGGGIGTAGTDPDGDPPADGAG